MTKAELKRLTSYKHEKYRNNDNLFVVEGVKMCQELLSSNYDLIAIYANEEITDRYQVTIITDEELRRISLLSTPNKAYCLVRKPQSVAIDYDNCPILALDGIKDPGNLGTIMRLADWFGVKDIVCSPDCVDVFNPKVVQASMGSVFRTNVHYENLQHFIKSLPDDFAIYGTVVENGENIYQSKLPPRGIIIIGSESFGISNEIQALVNHPLTIPRLSLHLNKPESLNASVATAIVLSEFKSASLRTNKK
ncbi:MAG: RNA methyltransferase [Bacteroidales bacterium]|jgi:TrmH family RNA methyltransferase|nr:RNA methyltransferase [Bacteroidales bacterium]